MKDRNISFKCVIDGLMAPQWICTKIDKYGKYHTAVGISKMGDLNFETAKRVAIANARVVLGQQDSVDIYSKSLQQIESSIRHDLKLNVKKFIHTVGQSSCTEIKNYFVLRVWVSPISSDVYVLVGILK